MVKSYLKYEQASKLGLISTGASQVIWTGDPEAGSSGAGRIVTGANEDVLHWDIKKGLLLGRWCDNSCTSEVTALARSEADPDIYAAGYADGTIRLWDSRLATVLVSFNGHRTGVTAIAFDKAGVRLASGSQDTEIVLWDLLTENGLFRLRGHTNQITGLQFLEPTAGDAINKGSAPSGWNPDGFLLSTGKDALLKLWDLGTPHCLETHVTQNNGECWSLTLSPRKDGCITAGNDGELKFWSIDVQGTREESETNDDLRPKILTERGIISRHTRDRTLNVKFHPTAGFVAAHGAEKSVEIFRIRSEHEVRRSLARKRKRRREKAAKIENGKVALDEDTIIDDQNLSTVDIGEFIVPLVNLRTSGKVRSVDWAADKQKRRIRLIVATSNNLIELYEVLDIAKEETSASKSVPDYNKTLAVELPGHRTDVRSLSLSSDDRMLASASNGSVKVWNIKTQTCLRTLDCGYALCSTFIPGDKILVVGTRNGDIELFDISSSALIDTVKAHEGSIFTLQAHPDGRSMVTGGADKTAKFWKFEVVEEEVPGSMRKTARFSLAHTRTLQVSDNILGLRFSPDGRLLAVATLDNTVKVFLVDSLKMFLNLYGHKLPVLSMDISYDSKLIVTCSADKNVRIWGLDFGDCHKALFAHQDSIMQVGFIPHNQDGNGHNFFSASKDRLIKYWDGDKFEQIQKLNGHHGEIWALAISRMGEFVVSASHDKSIRIWQQTDEQIFLEEEREKELEELYESTLVAKIDENDPDRQAEVVAAGNPTVDTLMAGEKIAEALDLGIEDLEVMREWHKRKLEQPNLAPPQRNIHFVAYGNISAEQHVLSVIEKIKSAALQDALLVLPFDKVRELFVFLEYWADRQWNTTLVCRILFFLLKTHHRQIIATKTMRSMLNDIRLKLRNGLQSQKNEIGFNLAALRVLGGQVHDSASRTYVDNEPSRGTANGQAAKRTFINVA